MTVKKNTPRNRATWKATELMNLNGKSWLVDLVVFVVPALIAGCASSQFTMPDQADLNAYKYIIMPEVQNDTHGLSDEFAKHFKEAGFSVVDPMNPANIPKEDAMHVLLCRYKYSATGEKATVRMTLVDAFQNKTVYDGKGVFGYGWDWQGDALGAARRSVKGLTEQYTGFDPNAVQKPDWEKRLLTLDQAKEHLSTNKKNLLPIEGIWSESQNLYTIAIIREESEDNTSERDVLGIVLEAKNPYWEAGDVKLSAKRMANQNVYTMDYFTGNKTPYGATIVVNNGVFTFSLRTEWGTSEQVTFIRSYPETSGLSSPESAATSCGTGFAVSPDGLIITAYHVVKDAKTIKVYLSKDKSVSARIRSGDPLNDLAVLKAENPTPDYLSVAPMRSVKTGDRVFTIGFPVSSVLGEEAKYTEGVVSSLSGFKGSASFVQITVPVQPGNSGGPLVNEKAEVVGIITSSVALLPFVEESGALPQNVNWAVKADYLRPLIELPHVDDKQLSREQCIAVVKKATFLIETE